MIGDCKAEPATGKAVAGVLCGAAASGQFEWTPESVAKSALCMVMSGPLLTGYTQTINDYYDREIDAINEPYRPIPSGRSTDTRRVTCAGRLVMRASET